MADGIIRIRSGAAGPADVITGQILSALEGLSFADADDALLICRDPVDPEIEVQIAGTFLAKTEASCSFEFQLDGELVTEGDWISYFQVTATRNGGAPGPVREDEVFTIRVLNEFA
jgi:hypothetical protein